jgi:hypothetical protein
MDCEMVSLRSIPPAHDRSPVTQDRPLQVGIGPGGQRSCLARCTVVNFDGEVLYDKFVAPTEPITGAGCAPVLPRPCDRRAPALQTTART